MSSDPQFQGFSGTGRGAGAPGAGNSAGRIRDGVDTDSNCADFGPSHYGGQRHETETAKAERFLGSGLERLGWKEEALRLLPKGHPAKVELARPLRQQTTLSLKWIARRLHMGSWTYVANLLAQPAEAAISCQNTLPLFPK